MYMFVLNIQYPGVLVALSRRARESIRALPSQSRVLMTLHVSPSRAHGTVTQRRCYIHLVDEEIEVCTPFKQEV